MMESERPYTELLLGCGHDRRKRYVAVPHHPRGWRDPKGPVTLDINRAVKSDLWCDLSAPPPWYAISRGDPEGRPHPLIADFWDEIHAYQVLEHLGRQGDAIAFFAHFSELWRILKPGGYFVGEVPSRFSGYLWGDPGHTRAIVPESLSFLDQEQYALQIDGPLETRSTMSEYRNLYTADFKVVDAHDSHMHFAFVLQAVKPSRVPATWLPTLDAP